MALPQSDQNMTEAEYLEFERESDIRHEFVNGNIVAMSGASNNHIVIVGNLQTTLNVQLKDSDCLVMASDLRVKVDSKKTYRYPDLTVVCDKPVMVGDENPKSLENPIVLFEVLSPSTASIDQIQKRDEYFEVPSLEEYLLVSQDAPRIAHYLRQPDDSWIYRQVSGLGRSLDLPSIGCTLMLSEVYRKITFPESGEQI